jgi:hypothetical protein
MAAVRVFTPILNRFLPGSFGLRPHHGKRAEAHGH